MASLPQGPGLDLQVTEEERVPAPLLKTPPQHTGSTLGQAATSLCPSHPVSPLALGQSILSIHSFIH